MNKLTSILIFLLFAFNSCDEVDELTHFNLDYQETIVIPAITDIDLPDGTTIPEITTDSEMRLEGITEDSDLIEEVKLSQSSLYLTTPTDGDFSFIKSIAIYISATDLDEVKVAWQDSISESIGDTLNLNTSDADLKEYIMADSFDLRINTVIHKIITTEHNIDFYNQFYVDAKILGQ